MEEKIYAAVAELLSDKNRWMQGAMARIKKDGSVCWCLLGAIFVVYNKNPKTYEALKNPAVKEAVKKIGKLLTTKNDYETEIAEIIHYNDYHSYEEVYALVKKANI